MGEVVVKSCGAAELELVAANSVGAADEVESREPLDNDCGAGELNAVFGPDERGAPSDNSCEVLELVAAIPLCVPDEDGGGATLDNSCEAGELEVANAVCVFDNDCEAGELEAVNAVCVFENDCEAGELEAVNAVCVFAEDDATADDPRFRIAFTGLLRLWTIVARHWQTLSLTESQKNCQAGYSA